MEDQRTKNESSSSGWNRKSLGSRVPEAGRGARGFVQRRLRGRRWRESWVSLGGKFEIQTRRERRTRTRTRSYRPFVSSREIARFHSRSPPPYKSVNCLETNLGEYNRYVLTRAFSFSLSLFSWLLLRSF